MFVGHYGPAAAVSGGRIKLWHGFVAVQVLDILWAPFVLLGIEKVRIVDGFTAANPFDLYHMPYTHSLLMAVVWSVLAGVTYWLLRRSAGARGGLIIAALVMSHWVCDYLMHVPDLPLYFGGPEFGLGLWNSRTLTIVLELGLFVLGFGIYLRATATPTLSRPRLGIIVTLLVMAFMMALQLYATLGPVPASAQEAAISGLACYIVFAALAAVIDKLRTLEPSNEMRLTT